MTLQSTAHGGSTGEGATEPIPRLSGLSTPVVELHDLSRVYGSEPPVIALRDVNLRIERGDFMAIVGPSGSGKSTLLNVLGCLDRQTSGAYLMDGIDVASLTDSERAALRGSRIGFVSQTFNLLAHRSVIDNVTLAEVYLGLPRQGRRERALAEIQRVGLADRQGFLPTKLSGGQQQRAAIARALMGSPSLLLCDEPTGNLDSANTAAVLGVFEDLSREGMTIVMITHDDGIAALARRKVRIVDGCLTEETS